MAGEHGEKAAACDGRCKVRMTPASSLPAIAIVPVASRSTLPARVYSSDGFSKSWWLTPSAVASSYGSRSSDCADLSRYASSSDKCSMIRVYSATMSLIRREIAL